MFFVFYFGKSVIIFDTIFNKVMAYFESGLHNSRILLFDRNKFYI